MKRAPLLLLAAPRRQRWGRNQAVRPATPPLLPGLAGFAALAALAALAACGSEAPRAGPGGPGKGPLIVRISEARAEQVERVVELTGTLGGAEEVTVSAEVDGRVERVAADLGDRVPLDGLLVQLSAAEPKLRSAQAEAEYLQALARIGVADSGLDAYVPESGAAVRKAQADLEEARKNLERGEELHRRGLAAQSELDTLRTRGRVAEAAHQAALEDSRSGRAIALGKRAAAALARKKVRDSSISSPVDGLVARRHVSLGEYVKAGQKVAELVVVDPLKLRGEVPERHVGAVVAGAAVRIWVDALGDQPFVGTISRVGPAVATASRTFPVEALVPNPDGRLRPGLFARAEIRAGADEEVVALPETAVASTAGVTKVFVEENGKARERKVQILRKRGGDALVTGELRAGDRVIVTAIARLFEGAQVQVDGAAETPAAPPATAGPQAGPGAAAPAPGGRG